MVVDTAHSYEYIQRKVYIQECTFIYTSPLAHPQRQPRDREALASRQPPILRRTRDANHWLSHTPPPRPITSVSPQRTPRRLDVAATSSLAGWLQTSFHSFICSFIITARLRQSSTYCILIDAASKLQALHCSKP